ncbi:MAG: hypothetical protein LBL28_06770 [Treponema sp.]|jgi:hypothetical protein|nr:hypothetical protein [Treponema sp.]
MGLLQKAVVKASPESAEPGIAGAGEDLILPSENGTPGDKSGEAAGPPGLEHELREYHKNHPAFQGIVLAVPPPEDGETAGGFFEKVSRTVRFFGTLFPLSPENGLVLVPDNIDRELLSHRLSKSLNTRTLYHFMADDPGAALSLLDPYWQDARPDP